MSLKKFIFFLVNDQGKIGQIKNGVVVWTNTPTPLPQAPDGNQEISIGWERSSTYHGNIRTYSLDLGALMVMGTILRNEWYTYNMDIIRYLLIKKLTYEYTNTTFKEYYKKYYKGQIDFSTVEDDQGGYRLNFRLIDGGLQRLLKANESTNYEIPLDIDSKNLELDGMIVQQSGKFLMPAVDITQNQYIMPISLISSEIYDNSALGFFTSVFTPYFGGPTYNFAPSDNYFLRTVKDVTVRIRGRIGVTSAGSYSFWIVGSSNTAIDPTNYPSEPGLYYVQPAVAAGTHVFDFDVTLNLPAGEKLFFYTTHPFNTTDSYTDTEIIVEFNFRPDTSVVKAFTMYDLGRKLIEKITGNADNFESTFLQTKNILYTSIDGIRGIDPASVKTNWRDYWQEVNVRCMAEMHITDIKIIISERINAYQTEPTQTAIELGEVKNLKVTDALDLLATSITVGNAEQQTDDANGKFDPMGYMVFTTPLKTITDKKYDLQSPYKASPYEIEKTRANYEDRETTDRDTDNSIVAIAALPTGIDTFTTTSTFAADGTPFTPGQPLLSITAATPVIRKGMKLRITNSVSNNVDLTVKSVATWFFGQLISTNEAVVNEAGSNITIEIVEGQNYYLDRTIPVSQLIDPDDVIQDIKDSLFNVPLSPKRILMTHFAWLAGMMYGYDFESLIFSSANRNKEMIAGGVVEKADVPVFNLGDPMFIPKYFEFDIVSPVNLPEIHELVVSPLFAFIWKGIRYTGFIVRDGIAPNDLEEQTFKLLSCPENDLLNLIK